MTLTCHPLWAVIITQPCIPPGVAKCQRLRSRLLLSCWYCRGWTTEMPSWPVFLPTCCGVFSRWWTRQHGSSMACITQTTSPTRSTAFIDSGLRRECGSRRPCSCTRPLMELRRHTWVNCFLSPICLVDVPSALLGSIVCWCRPWSCLLSAAGPSRSLDPPSGTACRTTWYLLRLCQPSVSV